MLKKVTIYFEPGTYYENHSAEWNARFIQDIINTELDGLSGFGEVISYTIDDMTTDES